MSRSDYLRETAANAVRLLFAQKLESQLVYFADDVDFEVIYPPPGLPVTKGKGKEAYRAFQSPYMTGDVVAPLNLTIETVYVDEAQQAALVQCAAEGRLTGKDIQYANRYIFVTRFKDGLIVCWQEYANPLAAAAIVDHSNAGAC
jgi:ketosteroid isomerase-like protein